MAMTEKQKQQHRSMPVHIGKSREPLYKRMLELAGSLNCRPNDLLWYSIDQMLQNPPTSAPSGSAPRTGKASGFWLIHDLNESGRIENIRIAEVAARGQVAGRLFFRYTPDDVKSRERALKQCERAADYDGQVAGITKPTDGWEMEDMTDGETVDEEVDGDESDEAAA